MQIFKQENNLTSIILTVHTRHSAIGNENKYPERTVRKIEPGIANDCNLKHDINMKLGK